MTFGVLAQVAGGSVAVAIALLGVIGAIMVAAILRYKNVDSVLKIWAALGTLTGLAFGAMGTYFFSKEQLQQKDAEVRQKASAIKVLADQTRQATQLLKTGGSTGPTHAQAIYQLEAIADSAEAWTGHGWEKPRIYTGRTASPAHSPSVKPEISPHTMEYRP